MASIHYSNAKKQQFQTGRKVDLMRLDKLEQYLDELSDGTDFKFRFGDTDKNEIELYMQEIILAMKIGVLKLQLRIQRQRKN